MRLSIEQSGHIFKLSAEISDCPQVIYSYDLELLSKTSHFYSVLLLLDQITVIGNEIVMQTPLPLLNFTLPVQASTSESDVNRHQILISKVGPHAGKVNRSTLDLPSFICKSITVVLVGSSRRQNLT